MAKRGEGVDDLSIFKEVQVILTFFENFLLIIAIKSTIFEFLGSQFL